jgi:glycosyltransferase involved in cell wall biosynthesis
MKIGLTTRTFYPNSGGLQAHTEELAKELKGRGHQVVVATRSISHSPSFQDFFFFSESVSQAIIHEVSVCVLRHHRIWNGLMWVVSKCIGRRHLRNFGIQLFQGLFTRQLVKAFKGVDAIQHIGQAHELIGFAAADAAKQLEVPFLIQPLAHPGQWGDSSFDLWLYEQADLILVNTEYERNALEKAGLSKPFSVVGTGVIDRQDGEADRFRNRYSVEGHMILFLGRKTEDKGYPLLRETFQRIHSHMPEVTLVCMGPGEPLELPSHQAVVDGSVPKTHANVIEIGFAPPQDKHDAIAACDLLCVPSEGESFGLVYMEAGLYAKPSIARRLPVLEELLGRHDAAFLVGKAYGEGNQVDLTPEELGEAIIKIFTEQNLGAQIGQNANRVAHEFIWAKIISNFEDAYNNAISTASGKTRLNRK